MGERLYYYSRGLPLRCVVVAHDDGAAVVAVMTLVRVGQRGMLTSWVIEWKRLSVWSGAGLGASSRGRSWRSWHDGAEAPRRDSRAVIWVRGSIVIAGASRFAAWVSLTTVGAGVWVRAVVVGGQSRMWRRWVPGWTSAYLES